MGYACTNPLACRQRGLAVPPVTTQTRRATRFAAAFVALVGAHGFADYRAQTHHQAMNQGRSGDATKTLPAEPLRCPTPRSRFAPRAAWPRSAPRAEISISAQADEES